MIMQSDITEKIKLLPANSLAEAINNVKLVYSKEAVVKELLLQVKMLNNKKQVLWNDHLKFYDAYWNHRGRNAANVSEMYLQLWNSKVVIIDEKLNRLTKIRDEYNAAESDIYDQIDEIHKNLNAIYAEDIAIVIKHWKVIEAKRDIKINVADKLKLQFTQTDNLIDRLKEGRFRDRKSLIIKIIKSFSRATGKRNVDDLIYNLKNFYGNTVFEGELNGND